MRQTISELSAALVHAHGVELDSIQVEAEAQRASESEPEASKEQQVAALGCTAKRTEAVKPLACSTAAMGRKCSSSSCLARDGVGLAVFKRCGGCAQAAYCSAHCQRVHWKAGHKHECRYATGTDASAAGHLGGTAQGGA